MRRGSGLRGLFLAFRRHPEVAKAQDSFRVLWCDADTARGLEGPRMWAAGQMAPGLNDVVFSMTRPAADVPWQHIGVAPVG